MGTPCIRGRRAPEIIYPPDRIKTPRGAVTFAARVTEDIMQGVVEANQGGGSLIQGEGWKNSNVNFLLEALHFGVEGGSGR